ncbi:hypothetical protein BGZ54_008317 [Gamsiella multidivaricata]|nr:hypothetical protein BGZ54_008317 [Gamsiella multidivaricata]
MASQYMSPVLWRTVIQRPDIVLLQKLVNQAKVASTSLSVASSLTTELGSFQIEPPIMRVPMDCIPVTLRGKATTLLGMNFGDSSSSPDFMALSVLQFSILSLYNGHTTEAEMREEAVVMLVKASSAADINGNCFGNASNVLHLAAFLGMMTALNLLIVSGGDPLITNGFGLNAHDIVEAQRHSQKTRYRQDDGLDGEAETWHTTNVSPLRIRQKDRADSALFDVEGHSDSGYEHLSDTGESSKLVELDLADKDQLPYRNQEQHQQEYNWCGSDDTEENDPGYSIGLHEDLAWHQRIRFCSSYPSDVTPLYSILKNRHGGQLELYAEKSKEILAFQAYQDYIAGLQIRLRSRVHPQSIASFEKDDTSISNKKAVHWSSTKRIRIYQRHINQEGIHLDQGGFDLSEEYEEHIQDQCSSNPSLCTESSTTLDGNNMYGSSSPYDRFNNSSLDLSAVRALSITPAYYRPLPEIPKIVESGHSSERRRQLQQPTAEPPTLVTSENSSRLSSAVNTVRGPRPLHSHIELSSSPLSTPLISASEPQSIAAFLPESASSSSVLSSPERLPRVLVRAFSLSTTESPSLRRTPNTAVHSYTFPGPRPSTSQFMRSDNGEDDTLPLQVVKSRHRLSLSAVTGGLIHALPVNVHIPNTGPLFPNSMSVWATVRSPQRYSNQKAAPFPSYKSTCVQRGSFDSDDELHEESDHTNTGCVDQDLATLGNQPEAEASSPPSQQGIIVHRDVVCSSDKHAYWKQRKDVKVVIPPQDSSLRAASPSNIQQDMQEIIEDADIQQTCCIKVPMSPIMEQQEGFETGETVEDGNTKHEELLGAALVNIHGISEGLEAQGYVARQSRIVAKYFSPDEGASTPNSMHGPPIYTAASRFSLWRDASEIDKQPKRRTLSSCPSPSTTNTGALYMRVRSICGFVLPIPAENTMISIRIDTGHEKVDTDYVPLEAIEILFNQEFCLPVSPGLEITMTLHLMQAPHLMPRFTVPPPPVTNFAGDDVPRQMKVILPDSSLSSDSAAGAKSTPGRRTRQLLPSFLKKSSPESSHRGADSSIITKAKSLGSRAKLPSGFASASSATMSLSIWSSRSSSRLGVDAPSTISQSSISSSGQSMLSKWKKGITSIHRSHKPSTMLRAQSPGLTIEEIEHMKLSQSFHQTQNSAQQLQEYRDSLGGESVDNTAQSSSHSEMRHNSSLRPPPQLSLSELQETETSLQILSRHIDFDDELCVARSAIAFSNLRSLCTNQTVTVEFQTVNNWADMNNYSQAHDMYISDASRNSYASYVLSRNEPKMDRGPSGQGSIIAKIMTTLCFIPGPEMDPEDAIFGDENFVPTEPQNLEECHHGLHYFQWQDRISFQGPLFYLTERNNWKEAWFCIVGSSLWQCRAPNASASPLLEQAKIKLERIRCLDLESVRQIGTGQERLKATAQYLEGQEFHSSCQGDPWNDYRVVDEEDIPEDESLCPVRNGFRLHLHLSNGSDNGRQFVAPKVAVQDFYAVSQEMAQKWVNALMLACRSRPVRPYWLRD